MMRRCFGPFLIGLIGILICFTQDARGSPLPDNEEMVNEILNKRNAWWSKKSDPALADLSGERMDGENSEQPCLSQAHRIDCYINRCVPDFVECGRLARSRSGFGACKQQHHECALECYPDTNKGPALSLFSGLQG
ncbi:uncharacterized protein LOC135485945 [Lineus longissimus]|uniref:uncharacterized protein LOC135485945 n=1 Tax=Lineus longissimus TaxID=88925 RepID=UPI002B4EA1F8